VGEGIQAGAAVAPGGRYVLLVRGVAASVFAIFKGRGFLARVFAWTVRMSEAGANVIEDDKAPPGRR
jgi:hypothetical protein